jgi:hypothetical protein
MHRYETIDERIAVRVRPRRPTLRRIEIRTNPRTGAEVWVIASEQANICECSL